MNGDERLLKGRVYGADHDDPDPGPRPDRSYAELVGGPLDGLLLDIHRWPAAQVDDGAALATELSRWPGPGPVRPPARRAAKAGARCHVPPPLHR